MQIIIDIPDRIYKRQGYLNIIDSDILRNALKNGTPLPKGHGRLIDADELQDYFEDNRSKLFHSKDCIIGIDNTPTIIKADKLCGAKMESEESDEVSN